MKALFALAAVATLGTLVSTSAMADQKLAQEKNCLACHAVDKKVVGPAYKDVAAKYGKQKDAVAYLSGKIQKGSSGVWGAIPMAANTQVNDAEAKKLATWILTIK